MAKLDAIKVIIEKYALYIDEVIKKDIRIYVNIFFSILLFCRKQFVIKKRINEQIHMRHNQYISQINLYSFKILKGKWK